MSEIQTDARISNSGLMWHFQYVIYDAKLALKHLEFQLKHSKDTDGKPHRQQVEAILANMSEHIAAMEAFLKEQQA